MGLCERCEDIGKSGNRNLGSREHSGSKKDTGSWGQGRRIMGHYGGTDELFVLRGDQG